MCNREVLGRAMYKNVHHEPIGMPLHSRFRLENLASPNHATVARIIALLNPQNLVATRESKGELAAPLGGIASEPAALRYGYLDLAWV